LANGGKTDEIEDMQTYDHDGKDDLPKENPPAPSEQPEKLDKK